MRDERTDGRQDLLGEILLPEANANGLLDLEDDGEESDRIESNPCVEEGRILSHRAPRSDMPAEDGEDSRGGGGSLFHGIGSASGSLGSLQGLCTRPSIRRSSLDHLPDARTTARQR